MSSLNSRMILLGVPGTLALFSHFALAVPAVSNDNFADATLIDGTGGTLNNSNNAASRETGEPFPGGGTSGQSVWYKWTAPSTGNWNFVTYSPLFNPVLGVYTGSVVSSLTEVVASNIGGSASQSVYFAATEGTTYYIDVASGSGPGGQFNLSWLGPVDTYNLGGRITDAAGKPAANVKVALSGSQPPSVVTDANGYYNAVVESGNYTVTPTSNYLTFNPTSRSVNITASNSAINFTSTVKPSISVSNATFAEGNAGTTNAVFTVKLSIPSALPVRSITRLLTILPFPPLITPRLLAPSPSRPAKPAKR